MTFFRTLGGSFGAAVLGSIHSNQLPGRLPAAVAESPGLPPETATNPAALHALPSSVQAPVVNAYAESLHSVFLWAVPVALAALVVALFLPQATLRGRVAAAGAGDGFAIPQGADADTQLENVIGQVLKQKGKSAAPEVLKASGSSLDIPTSWGVLGVYLRDAITGSASETSIERSVGVPHGVLRPFFDEIVQAGFLSSSASGVSGNWARTRSFWAVISSAVACAMGSRRPRRARRGRDPPRPSRSAALDTAHHDGSVVRPGG